MFFVESWKSASRPRQMLFFFPQSSTFLSMMDKSGDCCREEFVKSIAIIKSCSKYRLFGCIDSMAVLRLVSISQYRFRASLAILLFPAVLNTRPEDKDATPM